MDKFGSISAIFDAPIRLLMEVENIGESCALFLKLMPNICRIYQEDKYLIGRKVLSLEECYSKLVLKFTGRTNEAIAIMLFDSKGKIVFDGIINYGSINAVEVYSRKIIELVSIYSATSIILAHNHPSGVAIPSRGDIQSTDELSRILKSMRVTVIDHIIVADGDYVSMKECKIGETFCDS